MDDFPSDECKEKGGETSARWGRESGRVCCVIPPPGGPSSEPSSSNKGDLDAGLSGFEEIELAGDEFCDDGNNHKDCVYDGGDCCASVIDKTFCNDCLCKDPSVQIPGPDSEVFTEPEASNTVWIKSTEPHAVLFSNLFLKSLNPFSFTWV